MKEMKTPVAENRADLKNIPCGDECFSKKELLDERVQIPGKIKTVKSP